MKRGIIIYINSRFLQIPEGVTVRVAEVEDRTKREPGTWQKDALESPSGTLLSLDWRRARGSLAYIPAAAARQVQAQARHVGGLVPRGRRHRHPRSDGRTGHSAHLPRLRG